MTPLKVSMNSSDETHINASGDADSSMNISVDDASHCSENVTLSSPPRSARRFPIRPAGGGFGSAASRLFAEDEEDTGSTCKSLDLGMDLSTGGSFSGTSKSSHEESKSRPAHSHSSSDRGSRTPFRNRPRQKRQAERQLVTRDFSFDEDEASQDSPTDMMLQSPGGSPSRYRSPFRPAQSGNTSTVANTNKSPRYRTIDGRTVQSKNPFSPMYTDDSSAATAAVAPLSESLNFPVSLESSSSQGNSLGGPLLRHRLQKRDTNLNPSAFPSFAASAAAQYSTRDGYPQRQGRYSFTGSPIRETTMETDTLVSDLTPMLSVSLPPHKVRRRSKQEDIPGAETSSSVSAEESLSNVSSFYPSMSQQKAPQKTEIPPTLDMKDVNYGGRNANHSFYRWQDEISPTDVMSFPPSTPVPPTPSKPAKGRPKTHKYTPVRKAAVPPTPVPERRATRTTLDLAAEQHANNQQGSSESSSRFYSDFDVIGELGNGSFGNVFKVMSRLDGCMYAIKVAHRPAKGMADKDRMLKEVSLAR